MKESSLLPERLKWLRILRPHHFSQDAEVEVTLSDGTVLSEKVWNSNDAADPAVIRQKFLSAVQKTLGDEGADKAADLLLAADSLSGVSPIAQLISVA